jgi:hypothetical protein
MWLDVCLFLSSLSIGLRKERRGSLVFSCSLEGTVGIGMGSWMDMLVLRASSAKSLWVSKCQPLNALGYLTPARRGLLASYQCSRIYYYRCAAELALSRLTGLFVLLEYSRSKSMCWICFRGPGSSGHMYVCSSGMLTTF